MFEIACHGIVSCLVDSSGAWRQRSKANAAAASKTELIDYLEQTIEALLRCWLLHSRGVRLSVLEAVTESRRWRALKQFIECYGSDLFTQHFMNLGNLRGILHQGVAAYLESLQEEPEAEASLRLLSELGSDIPRDEAAHWLEVAIEAVVENYGEYVDYNSITTQSDRGEMLYTLLDFLRLQASYDRLAWNLRPVGCPRGAGPRGREKAAEIWRQAVAERTAARRRRPPGTVQAAEQEIRHAPAEHCRTSRRAICSALGDRPALFPGAAGGRGAPPRPGAGRVPTVGRAPQPVHRRGLRRRLRVAELAGRLGTRGGAVQWHGDEPVDEPSDLYVRLPQVRLSRREVERQVRQISNDAEQW